MICKREEVELVPLRASYLATWGPKVCSQVCFGFDGSRSLSAVRDLQLGANPLFRSQLERVVTGDL